MPKRKRSYRGFSDYQYEPLCSSIRKIRLIRLQPSPVLRDVVKSEIEIFNVDEAPEYEAISYAWGAISDRTPIKVGKRQRLLITRSLELALRYLRHPDKERLLWADAVCINQDKTAEKNEAVSQMHNIYRNASQVIVWLGHPIRPWSFNVILNMPDEVDENSPPYFRGKCQLENRLNSNARALVQFSRLPWFRRGWVIQEVCFARHIQIQFGRHRLSWEHFEKVAVKLASVLPDFLRFELPVERKPYIAIQKAISGLADTRSQLYHKEQAMTLSSLLPFARTKLTTDPRDKIFAFTNLLSVVPPILQVNYNEETKTLFVRVAQLLLRGDVGLKLLAECEFNSHNQAEGSATSLPSWAPDWARDRICESLPGGLSPNVPGHGFSAARHFQASSFEIVDETLLLDALIWDDILFLDPLASITQIVPYINNPLLAHLGVEPDPVSHRLDGVILSNIQCHSSQELSRLCSKVSMCNRDSQGLKVLNDDGFPYDSLAAENYQRIVGRSLLLTSKYFVGWAPPAAVVGDVIAIIPGCHVPMVLRKSHGSSPVHGEMVSPSDTGIALEVSSEEGLPSYIVIGEACKHLLPYLAALWLMSCLDVHGIMEGEIAPGLNCDSRKMQKIAII